MSVDERCSQLHEEQGLFSPNVHGVHCVSAWEGRYLRGSCTGTDQYRIAGCAYGHAAVKEVLGLFQNHLAPWYHPGRYDGLHRESSESC